MRIRIFTCILFLLGLAACQKDEVAKDTTPVERLTDEQLMDVVQKQTFKYFWDFAHPVSGLSRERSNTWGYGPEVVTSGGSGFGAMAILVGIERGFITREQGLAHLLKMVRFLEDKSDRFHGAFSHWLFGDTGKVKPFSANDDGGDLVETAFLIQGLLTVRQYFGGASADEVELRERINRIWHGVEWDWYTKGENKLYWHWSPNVGWKMNHQIRGFDETLITYVLAASSPTHPIAPEVYHQGWTDSDHFQNGNSYYGIRLPLGFPFGGPLFFTHYSYLGLNPKGLKDQYADYWEQNRNHTLINRAYCIDNPKKFVGYSEKCWGLTSSDNHEGYNAHSPTNDLGVITPTAALSAMPYTPEYSMQAMRYFYEEMGDKLWGPYGFYDAFNLSKNWVAESYLAIDQGPIILMIENHRTGLLWKHFMSAPEVQQGLTKLGFTYEK